MSNNKTTIRCPAGVLSDLIELADKQMKSAVMLNTERERLDLSIKRARELYAAEMSLAELWGKYLDADAAVTQAVYEASKEPGK